MGPKSIILFENEEEVIRLSKEGKSNMFIGDKFGVSGGLVGLFLKERGILSKERQNAQDGDLTKYKDEIIQRYLAGESCYALDIAFKCPPGKVNKYLRKWGHDTSKGQSLYKGGEDKLINHIDEIKRLYLEEKIGVDTIAKKLGTTGSSIRRLLQRENLMRTYDEVTINIDIDYFKKIDTRNKAYVLGLMYSDGNNESSLRAWRISLKYDDLAILEKIKQDMKYEGDIFFVKGRKYKKRNGEWSVSSPQYKLAISKTKMCQDLIKLGCPPNKTWKLRFPTEDQVPREFISDFLRGYCDGDGSISKKHCNISFIGNKFFIKEMINYLPLKEMPILKHRQSERYTNDQDKQLLIFCAGIKHGAHEVLNFLYGSCQETLYLPRKYELAQHWLSLRG